MQQQRAVTKSDIEAYWGEEQMIQSFFDMWEDFSPRTHQLTIFFLGCVFLGGLWSAVEIYTGSREWYYWLLQGLLSLIFSSLVLILSAFRYEKIGHTLFVLCVIGGLLSIARAGMVLAFGCN